MEKYNEEKQPENRIQLMDKDKYYKRNATTKGK